MGIFAQDKSERLGYRLVAHVRPRYYHIVVLFFLPFNAMR